MHKNLTCEMRYIPLILFVCLFNIKQDGVSSIHLSELRVPAHVTEGSDVLLGCIFDLEKSVLYSVKWYKDFYEFYRYVEYERSFKTFYNRGVDVDVQRSSMDTVWLRNVSSASAGTYTCEVQGDAPTFSVVLASKNISVYLLPEHGPVISGGEKFYRVGDVIHLICSSKASRPAALLKWRINGELAPKEYLHRPWIKPSKHRPDAFNTYLRLLFTVTSEHFQNGIVHLKCESTIAPIYNEESSFIAKGSQLESIDETTFGEYDEDTSEELAITDKYESKENNSTEETTNSAVCNCIYTSLFISILIIIAQCKL